MFVYVSHHAVDSAVLVFLFCVGFLTESAVLEHKVASLGLSFSLFSIETEFINLDCGLRGQVLLQIYHHRQNRS